VEEPDEEGAGRLLMLAILHICSRCSLYLFWVHMEHWCGIVDSKCANSSSPQVGMEGIL
jgi:hypothetical protein